MPNATSTETVVLPVTLNGVTKQITFNIWRDQPHRATSGYVAIAQCGRTGKKRWRTNLAAWLQPSGDWRVDLTYYGLNRNTGRVHSWDEKAVAELEGVQS